VVKVRETECQSSGDWTSATLCQDARVPEGVTVEASHVADDLESVLLTEDRILSRVAALAGEIAHDFAGRDPLLVGVLGGAATFTVDLARAFAGQVEVSWMAIRSYATLHRGSGSVRVLKDLDVDIAGRHVIIVDGVIDTGLTMSWLIGYLAQRRPASVAVCALMRKPDTPAFAATPTYIGFDVGAGLVVGYGLDYRGRYRNLRCAAVLAPHVYRAAAPSSSPPP
jgi:hypoxanthine phosphoribosyltransferase